MKNVLRSCMVLLIVVLFAQQAFAQLQLEPDDPPPNTNIPDFYKSKLSDIETEIANLKIGKSRILATSPGGLPVYGVYYGAKDDLQTQANYNSAVAARNTAFYARKDAATKPVVFFVGPVHGQEVEGIVGLLNLIHIAETGKDYRGREWPELMDYFGKCRVIIIPCGNPDGRKRCPYDSYVGLPTETMTKYGQGTKLDGTLWRWPAAKSVHPMKGDVGILGAYFNDNGINMMHDDFFFPMAEETKAILKVARDEAPDVTVSLHSYGANPPVIGLPSYAPWFMKERTAELAKRLNQQYKTEGLSHVKEGRDPKPGIEDKQFPPTKSFNLVSALYNISGSMAFVFECDHGTTSVDRGINEPLTTHEDILDLQLFLYKEIFGYVLQNRLYWE